MILQLEIENLTQDERFRGSFFRRICSEIAQNSQRNAAISASTTVILSPDGKFVLIDGSDCSRLYGLSDKLLAKLEGRYPRFSPDGKFVLTFATDGSQLYNLSGKQLAKLQGSYVRFSSDRKWILSSSNEEDISRIYDLLGNLVAEYPGSTLIADRSQSHKLTLGFKDGNHLLTLSNDGRLQSWPIDNGLDDLLAQGCNQLKNYLTANPQEMKKLEFCRNVVSRK